MIRIMCRYADGQVEMDAPLERLADLLKEAGNVVWVDMQGRSNGQHERILADVFHFHPLAIEDALKDSHVPKLDDYGTYLYLVFHIVALGAEPMDIDTQEIDVFLGPNYLVTLHEDVRRSIERLWNAEHHVEVGLARGPAMLLYELLDAQIDNFIPLIDAFEEELERLGDDIFRIDQEQRELLNRLLTAKSSALRLVRILAPQRELLGRLSTGEYRVVPSQVRLYYRDIYDHLMRLASLADSMRDLASSTIETHLALVNNRMNEVMKLLTMVSTIFIPLSFLAGVYGMNFEHMPELEIWWFYPLIWGVFLSIALTMLWIFRRKKWL
ncbi:magnesium/cobalt transporter CorA [Caldilinea sp.]|uniref:magnesium/cobalt transporter CorA n=1 Tax=Caldilinea sp. TaxID=2293560 RepID=UPI002617EC12|nr:magnesium/cobalt transporter CorA [Caldilinea sp.]